MECLTQLEDQASKKRVSPAQVRSFYQIVHTLKGTAVMVEQAHRVVEDLHAIEGHLACRNIVESARNPDWLKEARTAMTNVQQTLEILQRKEKFPSKSDMLVKGFLVKSTLPGAAKILWFPVSCVARIVSPDEMAGNGILCVDGAWVPVIGSQITEAGREVFGIAIRSQTGNAVIALEEVSGIFSWSDAQNQGAGAGLELFERGVFAKPKRKPKSQVA